MVGPEYNSAGAGATPQRGCFASTAGAGSYPPLDTSGLERVPRSLAWLVLHWDGGQAGEK